MISYEEALAKVLEHASPPLARERVNLAESSGRVLAEAITARFDLPRFDQSAVDGFAVLCSDTESATSLSPVTLAVTGRVRAGDSTHPVIRSGCAIKTMTGARIARRADAVVMKEDCDEADGKVIIRKCVKAGDNIRYRGEEYSKGAPVLPKGTRITPPVAGLLATFGHASVCVSRLPRISLLVTGSELVAPGERLSAGKIYDSNSPALCTACRELGIDCDIVRLQDETKPIRNAVRAALRRSDIVLTSGGISVGEHDLIKDIFADAGIETVFWGVAIKPGKPCYFGAYFANRETGRRGPQNPVLVFGLPGNPVAALLCFQHFVTPAINRKMGKQHSRTTLSATLSQVQRKKAGRLEWLRGTAKCVNGSLKVTPSESRGSHMLGGLANADCLIEFPSEQNELDVGDNVTIEFLPWRS